MEEPQELSRDSAGPAMKVGDEGSRFSAIPYLPHLRSSA